MRDVADADSTLVRQGGATKQKGPYCRLRTNHPSKPQGFAHNQKKEIKKPLQALRHCSGFPSDLLRLRVLRCHRSLDAGRQLFLDTCRLAAALTQVVQLGTAHVTTALDFHGSDQGRVGLERTFHAFDFRSPNQATWTMKRCSPFWKARPPSCSAPPAWAKAPW